MNVEYHRWWSSNLNRDMELKVYGEGGKPLLIFPCAGGRFYEAEDFGMIEALRWFIEERKIQVFTVDSVDNDSWLAQWKWPGDRAWRHEQYDRYIAGEVAPFIRERMLYSCTVEGCDTDGRTVKPAPRLMVTGASMGGYHAANFFFRHPDIFDTTIALSGLYAPEYFVGAYRDAHVDLNFPLLYLPQLSDPWQLAQYRQSTIIVCVGQGAWEEMHVRETRALEAALQQLDVPAWFDYWGFDVNHDWPWWKKQLPYFLGQLKL